MGEGKILLVEDNADDELLTRRALSRHNLANDVDVARDGQQALEMLHGTDAVSAIETPRLILLDLKLPRIDGLEVLRRIRGDSRTQHIPVVILTSSTEESDMLNGYEGGANSFVQKPVDFQQFVKAVGTLGLYWLVVNRPPPDVA